MTLIEVIVGITLVAALSAVTIPAMRGRMRDGSADAIVTEFNAVQAAVRAYRQDVGRMPPYLDYLIALPASPTDWCTMVGTPPARPLPAINKANWRGPYLSRTIGNLDLFYTFADNDSVDTQVYRNAITVNGTGTNVSQLIIYGVDTATAHLVDSKIDGVDDPTAGQLRWTISGMQAKLTYSSPIALGDVC
jgi:type II secretory pathway pseudopilin PulG